MKKKTLTIKKIDLKTLTEMKIKGGYVACGYCKYNQLCNDCDGSEFYKY